MGPIVITWEGVLVVLGAIITFGGATAVIQRWLSPYRELKKLVEKHSLYLDNDKKSIAEIKETDRVMCRAILALLDHAITGNSDDKMRAAKELLQQHLIDN